MSSTGSTKRSQSSRADQPDAFDARVERAWLFMRAMFFTPEEHAMLSEAVVRLVSQEQGSDQSHNTHPKCP